MDSTEGPEERTRRYPAGSGDGAGGVPAPARPSLEARYSILTQVGEGGMARVHGARDRVLERAVAFKTIRRRHLGDPEQVALFYAEAERMAQLEHPGIVPVYDLGQDGDGRPSFAMKLVQGRTLGELVKEVHKEESPPLERLPELLEVVLKVCETLSFAHSQGVLHCDLKPDNVMVGDHGEVYLMDWGVAREIGGGEGEVAGTPNYMAPEQAAGLALDERADVFGVGALLHHALTHQAPYPGRDETTVLARARERELRPLAELASGTPAGLLRIVERALARRPEERQRDAAELRRDLRAFLLGAWRSTVRSYRAGEWVCREGDAGECAYEVIAGECEVVLESAEEKPVLRVLGPGAHLGEIALFTRRPRSAGVRALSELTLREIPRETFDEHVGLDSWLSPFVHTLSRRFLEREQDYFRADAARREAELAAQALLMLGSSGARGPVPLEPLCRELAAAHELEPAEVVEILERRPELRVDRARGTVEPYPPM